MSISSFGIFLGRPPRQLTVSFIFLASCRLVLEGGGDILFCELVMNSDGIDFKLFITYIISVSLILIEENLWIILH